MVFPCGLPGLPWTHLRKDANHARDADALLLHLDLRFAHYCLHQLEHFIWPPDPCPGFNVRRGGWSELPQSIKISGGGHPHMSMAKRDPKSKIPPRKAKTINNFGIFSTNFIKNIGNPGQVKEKGVNLLRPQVPFGPTSAMHGGGGVWTQHHSSRGAFTLLVKRKPQGKTSYR